MGRAGMLHLHNATASPPCPARTMLEARRKVLAASHGDKIECVWQALPGGLCAGSYACVPIETLPEYDWRLFQKVDDSHGWQPADAVVLHPLCPASDSTVRRIYLDVGANTYESSIGGWFRATYPDGKKYKVTAFEAEHVYDKTYRDHPDVELLHFAAATRNGTISWGIKGIDSTGGKTRKAIDMADFLQRRVAASDFVVMKMDIEGAEYAVLPHLLATGAIDLVDELFVEVHTEVNTCCRPPRDKGRHFADALRLVRTLRAHRVYAHMWG